MKKIICILLAALMALCLFSCGGAMPETPTETPVATPETVIPSTPSDPDAPVGPVEQALQKIEGDYPLITSLVIKKAEVGHHETIKSPAMEISGSAGNNNLTFSVVFYINDENTKFTPTEKLYVDLSESNYFFDVYLKPLNTVTPAQDYTKITLTAHRVELDNVYYCKAADTFYPLMEVGTQYSMVIVAREGDTILGWNEEWIEFSQASEDDARLIFDNPHVLK